MANQIEEPEIKTEGNPRKRPRKQKPEPGAGAQISFGDSDGPVEWKKIKQEQRDLKKKRKEKKHADFYKVSIEAKQLWEIFRVKKEASQSKEVKTGACDKAFKLLKPHLKRCIILHDMSRVLQSIIDAGGRNIRKTIFNELASDIVELSKDKYGCHTVLKLLESVDKQDRRTILNQVRGNIVKLLKHKFCARVVDILYSTGTNKQEQVQMVMECFGPEFKVFADNSCTNMDELLAKYPDKRERVLSSAKEILDKAIGRGGYLKETILMELMCQYLSNCDDESRTECIDSMKETLVHMYDSREGTNLALICIWHGTAQVRKAIIKCFKGKVVDVARQKYGHIILLAIFDCVDDTKLISKTIIKELVEHLATERGEENLLLNQFARKVLYYLVHPRNLSMNNCDIIEMLKKGDGNLHSKKNVTKRREELISYAMEGILPVLNEYGDALHPILSTKGAALIINGFVDPRVLVQCETVPEKVASELLKNIANWIYGLQNPAEHAAVIKLLIAKDESRTSEPLSELIMQKLSTSKTGPWYTDPKLIKLQSTMAERFQAPDAASAD